MPYYSKINSPRTSQRGFRPFASRLSIVSLVGRRSIYARQFQNPAQKDYRQFLHVRGLSRQKQTDLVMETWINHPEFPHLTVVASSADGFSLPGPARIASNLTVLLGDMPTPDLRKLQLESGVHLLPSVAEGFGHALNEARAASAVLVTTDGPPMHDFVSAGAGFLVPARSENIQTFGRLNAYVVTEPDLVTAVERVLDVPFDALTAMGHQARLDYEREAEAFRVAVREVVRDLGLVA